MTRMRDDDGHTESPAPPRRAWSATNPGNAAARRELAGVLLDVADEVLTDGNPVLDIGCGTGWWLETLAQAGLPAAALHGLERDPKRVVAAAQRVPGASIRTGDAQALPYPDGTFGLVTLIVVLSSLPRSAVVTALCEARRVLAPGGNIALYEPRVPNPLNRRTHLLRRSDLDRAGLVPRHVRTLTLAPPLGRRLGPLTAVLHPALSRIAPLRSHRLVQHRRAAQRPSPK
jgi:ubiquinone/menaquinone biosynthesis C-methylase UbiE